MKALELLIDVGGGGEKRKIPEETPSFPDTQPKLSEISELSAG
jgi:hypothetical protein